jgi:hypothetical protein
MWAEPYAFLYFGDCGVRLAEADQRHAELAKCGRVVGYERNRGLKFDPRFVQAVLQPAKEAERLTRAGAVCIAFDCFEQQLFGSRFKLTAKALTARSGIFLTWLYRLESGYPSQ